MQRIKQLRLKTYLFTHITFVEPLLCSVTVNKGIERGKQDITYAPKAQANTTEENEKNGAPTMCKNLYVHDFTLYSQCPFIHSFF